MSHKEIRTVNVIGLGYIGLPTATFLASSGLEVVGVDIDESKIESINRGEVPFVEPDFDTFFANVLTGGNLKAQTHVERADAFIIAVPTPLTALHSVDLKFVKSAVESISPVVNPGDLIVLESTSPPGSTMMIKKMLEESRRSLDLSTDVVEDVLIAHCPERVLPGNVMEEMTNNDRVVGGINPASAEAARELYSTFCDGEILVTDSKTAEMVKLVENSFRDVNIAFANELSLICDELDVNVWDLIKMANHHPRVNILSPGPGVGGHCIAVDPWFLVDAAPAHARLIRTAREVNDSKPQFVVGAITKIIEEQGARKIALLGLAFKADIDDLRESPSQAIASAVASLHPDTEFLVVEPYVSELPQELEKLSNVKLSTADEALGEAEGAVLLVDHSEFRNSAALKNFSDPLIDTRGINLG